MKRITISTEKPYDVLIGSGILDDIGTFAKEAFSPCRICIITDSTVNSLYASRVAASLKAAGFDVTKVTFPNGEHSKNITTYANVLEAMALDGITTGDMVLALGGGVVGDLAGFVASTYMRGIRHIQVPTTLTSAIDSSVGGKTGVDLLAGKNLAGTFWQPSLVVIDSETLDTLPPERLRSGLAEAVKCAAVSDLSLISHIRDDEREYIIERCISIKKSLIEIDEQCQGLSQLLNYGHTVGHGIEKLSAYSTTHGEAVAKGMVAEARAAYNLGFTKTDISGELAEILASLGFDTSIPFDAEALYAQALMDKKIKNGSISIIVPEALGKCTLHKLPLSDLLSFIRAGLS